MGDRLYEEPVPTADDLATIKGSLKEGSLGVLLTPARRARIVSIDRLGVPTGPRQPTPFFIRDGSHAITAICEHEIDTGIAYGNLDVRVLTRHQYVLHCEGENPIYNAGTRFWIEDLNDAGRTVSEAHGWGPSHGPAGRRF